MLNFGNGGTEFPLPSSATRVWSAQSEKEKKKKLTNELWQCHCRNRGINFWQLWQWHCRKWGKKKKVTKNL